MRGLAAVERKTSSGPGHGRNTTRAGRTHAAPKANPLWSGLAFAGPTPVVQRQPTTGTAPTFSVNQAAYLALVNQALGQMSGHLVDSETLATTVVPIMRAMLANVTWKDASGASHGGGVVQHTIGTGAAAVTLNLQMILDDAANSLAAGEFTRTGSTDGVMEIFVQRNTTADELAETMYHEAMHLASWLVNRPTPALAVRSAGRSGPSGAVATLDLSRALATTQIATVRRWLDTLAQSVNSRRGTGAQITAANLDQMSRWLVEEINVRIETEVFRLVASTQQMLTTRGPSVIIGTGPNWEINRGMVNRYVFDFSHVFLPSDRTGLTTLDQQTLDMLVQILEGMYQSRVRRRFNPSPYLVGRGIPRAPFTWTPPPLTPPSTFLPVPTPP